MSRNVLKLIVLIISLLVLWDTCLSEGDIEVIKKENSLKDELQPYLNAILNEEPIYNVQEIDQAYNILSTIPLHYNQHIWVNKYEGMSSYLLESQVKTYLMLIDKYKNSRASIIAMFCIGNVLRKYDIKIGEKILEKLVSEYPDTFEACFANSILRSIQYREDTKNINKLNSFIESYKNLLLYAKKIDLDKTNYAKTWRKVFFCGDYGLLYPTFCMSLGFVYESSGEKNKALDIYKEIMRDYPESEYSEEAFGRVELLKNRN